MEAQCCSLTGRAALGWMTDKEEQIERREDTTEEREEKRKRKKRGEKVWNRKEEWSVDCQVGKDGRQSQKRRVE